MKSNKKFKSALNVALALTVALMVALITGCGLGGATDESRSVVDAYYDAYSNGDIDTIISLMHPSLIDNLGGTETAVAFFSSIRAVHGDILETKHTSFSIEGSKSNSMADFTVDSTYENGNTTADLFSVLNEDGVYTIVSIDIPTAGTIEQLSAMYCDALITQNFDVLYDLLLPAATSSMNADEIEAFFAQQFDAYGPLLSVADSTYYGNLYQQSSDNAYFVGVEDITFTTDYGTAIVELGYGVQDGILGVLSVEFLS